jgi:GTPase SAR1 family protein
MTEPQRVEVPTENTGLTEKEALRLVLFGLPAAGKSSLLGALLQTSDTQPIQLKGSIEDRSRRLEELRQRVYFSNQPTRTVEEVVPYPVEYRPLPVGGVTADPVSAILIDCDGQVAIDLLRRRKSLTELSVEHALAKAVLDADALLLIIDASAPVKQMEVDFEEFGRFLAQMELSRGARTDVGGLPVFLVLTKCDLLARPDQTREHWQKQIEERQRYVAERFKNYIRRRKSDQEKRTFGLIDLYQAATATSHPRLANAGANPLEPYGVGSLFQQAFHQAGRYRERRRAARKRLIWTIALGAAIVGLLIGLLLAFLFFPSSPFVPDYSTLAQRLAGSPTEVENRLKAKIAQRDGPDFPNWPAGRREELVSQIKELEGYLVYYRKVFDVIWPGVIESEAELRKVREQLATELVPPKEWAKTEAAKLEADHLRDADAMLQAADQARTWYQRTGDRLRDLWAFRDDKPPINWRRFQERSDAALAEAANPPFTEEDVLSKGPYGVLKRANALRIDTVKRAKTAAEKAQKELAQVRRVAAALGLLALGRDYPDVLNIPPSITLEQCVERVTALKKAYPGYLTEFAVGDLPEVMREEVTKRTDQFYRDLLTPGRTEVLRQLKANGGDTVAGWVAVGKWLQAPKELAEWRTLVGALNRLRVPPPPDPITELATFLGVAAFPLRLPAVEVIIPLGLELSPKSGSALEIFQPRVGGTSAVVTLTLEEDGISTDARAGVRRCVFRAAGNNTINFVPGDDVYATLTLTGDKVMAWKMGNRSAMYTFERLSLPAQIAGRIEEGAGLRVLGTGNRLPVVPDLLPEVRR